MFNKQRKQGQEARQFPLLEPKTCHFRSDDDTAGPQVAGQRFRHSKRWSMVNLEISRIGVDIEIKIEICQSEGSNCKAACWEVKTVLLM